MPFMGGITFMPFVRDSKLAPTTVEKPLSGTTSNVPTVAAAAAGASAKKGENGAQDDKIKEKKADKPTTVQPDVSTTTAPNPAAAPVPAVSPVPVPVESPPLTPEAQAVADKIAAVGDDIRKLKAAKVQQCKRLSVHK